MSNPNRGVELHIDNLRLDLQALDEFRMKCKSGLLKHKLLIAGQQCEQAVADIYIKSNMRVPDWCKDE